MPNDFIDARGLVNEPDNDLLSLLTLVNLAKDNKATLTPQENRIDSLFKQPMSVDAKANFIKTLGQDLRNQQPLQKQFTNKTEKIDSKYSNLVEEVLPPKPHTDTNSLQPLFALLALLGAKSSIGKQALIPGGVTKILETLKPPSDRGFSQLAKNPPSPF